jgi:hypothetical protein
MIVALPCQRNEEVHLQGRHAAARNVLALDLRSRRYRVRLKAAATQ